MISHLTFDPVSAIAVLPPTNAPIRIAARQMRWLRAAFAGHVARMSAELGVAFEIDTTKLGGAFVRWLRVLEQERPRGREDRREFFDFAASLMMQQLVADMPLKVRGAVLGLDHDSQAAFWPEGYVCTLFCLAVHAAVVRQEYAALPALSPKVHEVDFWWTYRENSIEDHRLASGFLQAILGHSPDWTAPDRYCRATFAH